MRNNERIDSTEYNSWRAMKKRCYCPTHQHYKSYGARGITVCDRWRSNFDAFLSDMGKKPTPAHTLERKRVNENYVPNNCTWATVIEQANNRRSTIYLTAYGKTQAIGLWALELGLSRQAIKQRHYAGFTAEDCLYSGNLQIRDARYVSSKLTSEQITEIRNSEEATGALVSKYAVERHTIWRIRTGRYRSNAIALAESGRSA